MGSVISFVTKAVAAPVVGVFDKKAGKAVAKAGDDAGKAVNGFTANVGKAFADAGKAVGDSFGKDGVFTNFVEDVVPFGGFATAIVHAAAGNKHYAEAAAVKGVSSTITLAASVVGGAVGGPAGAALIGGLGAAAAQTWEGAMKNVMHDSVKNKFDDLSAEGVIGAGLIGAATNVVGGKAGKAGKKVVGAFKGGMKTVGNQVAANTAKTTAKTTAKKAAQMANPIAALNPLVGTISNVTVDRVGKTIAKKVAMGTTERIADATGYGPTFIKDQWRTFVDDEIKQKPKNQPPPLPPPPPIPTSPFAPGPAPTKVMSPPLKTRRLKPARIAAVCGVVAAVGAGAVVIANRPDSSNKTSTAVVPVVTQPQAAGQPQAPTQPQAPSVTQAAGQPQAPTQPQAPGSATTVAASSGLTCTLPVNISDSQWLLTLDSNAPTAVTEIEMVFGFPVTDGNVSGDILTPSFNGYPDAAFSTNGTIDTACYASLAVSAYTADISSIGEFALYGYLYGDNYIEGDYYLYGLTDDPTEYHGFFTLTRL